MQYVGVRLGKKTYSYQWDGDVPMEVGDRAVIPANYLNDMPSFGDVVVVYASREEIAFKGELKSLLGKVHEVNG